MGCRGYKYSLPYSIQHYIVSRVTQSGRTELIYAKCWEQYLFQCKQNINICHYIIILKLHHSTLNIAEKTAKIHCNFSVLSEISTSSIYNEQRVTNWEENVEREKDHRYKRGSERKNTTLSFLRAASPIAAKPVHRHPGLPASPKDL